jgi:hypothetical protein
MMFISVQSTEGQLHNININHIIDVVDDANGLLVRLSASSFTQGQSRPSSFQIRDETSKAKLLKALYE